MALPCRLLGIRRCLERGRQDDGGCGTKVLVTGVSGYIGLHCAAELLEQGYSVNAPRRRREASVRRAVGSVSTCR